MKTIAKSFLVAGLIAFAAVAAPSKAVAAGQAGASGASGKSQAAPGGKSFSALDKDKDGQLSREEFLGAGVPSPHERFMNCDTDSSFSLSPEEYAACMKK